MLGCTVHSHDPAWSIKVIMRYSVHVAEDVKSSNKSVMTLIKNLKQFHR